ncbi:MAG TPA: VWA domain-containing protein, partial [Pirellulales bacterium]
WQRLRQNLLLLLQLLLVALVLIALTGPSWRSNSLQGDRFIFLFDASASMGSTDAEPNRFAAAKAKLNEYLDAMPSGATAMLVSFADGAKVEQGFTDNRAELKRRLAAVQPTQRTTSIDEALRIAAAQANPGQSSFEDRDVAVAQAMPATMYVLSDGRLQTPSDFFLGNLTPIYVPFGKPDSSNLAILAFSVGRNSERPQQREAFCRIQNNGPDVAKPIVQLFLLGDDLKSETLIEAKEVTIEPNAASGAVFPLPEFSGGVLEARIVTKDALTLDDRAWTSVAPPRLGKVLLVTPGNRRLMLALTAKGSQKIAEVVQVAPPHLGTKEYEAEAATGAFDLIIYDQCSPKAMPQANTLFIGSLPPVGWKQGELGVNPLVLSVDRFHPLTQLVEFNDVRIVEARQGTKSEIGGRVLVDSTLGPLLTVAPREGFQDTVLSMALVNGEEVVTDWPIKPTFAVFALNLLQTLAGGAEASSLETARPGKPVALRNPVGLESATITTPSGKSFTVPRGRNNSYDFLRTDEVGPYQVVWKNGDRQTFVVNLFDAEESDVRAQQKLTFPTAEVAAQAPGSQVARYSGGKWVIVLALLVLLIEWYIYNRRVYL